MPANGSKQGDSLSEKLTEKYEKQHREIELHVERAKIRQEMASSDWDEEDSKVIHAEVDRRLAERKPVSEPPKSGFVGNFQRVTKGWPWWGQLILVLALLGMVAWRGMSWIGLLP